MIASESIWIYARIMVLKPFELHVSNSCKQASNRLLADKKPKEMSLAGVSMNCYFKWELYYILKHKIL